MNKKWAFVFLLISLFSQAMNRKLDLSKLHARQYITDTYNCESYEMLKERLKDKNKLSAQDEEYVIYLIKKIEKEYQPIANRWRAGYSWDIKPIEDVSWQDIEIYQERGQAFNQQMRVLAKSTTARY